jgi:hypothetical protein
VQPEKVFLNATPLIAFENKAGCDADRDKNGKPSRSDVDGVSNAAMGEYEQTLQKKETEDDRIQHRSLDGGMHTDGGSTLLKGKVKRSKAKPDNLIAIVMTVMSRLRFLGILEGSA